MNNTALTIRRATAADAFALRRLAAIDSGSPPTGDVLLAEVGDELWAAVSIDTGGAAADGRALSSNPPAAAHPLGPPPAFSRGRQSRRWCSRASAQPSTPAARSAS